MCFSILLARFLAKINILTIFFKISKFLPPGTKSETIATLKGTCIYLFWHCTNRFLFCCNMYQVWKTANIIHEKAISVWAQFAASSDLLPPSSEDYENTNFQYLWHRRNWYPKLYYHKGFYNGVDLWGTFWAKWLKTAWKLQNQHFGDKTVLGPLRQKPILGAVREYLDPPRPHYGKLGHKGQSLSQKIKTADVFLNLGN